MGYSIDPSFGDYHWRDPVAAQANLPAAGNNVGDVRLTTSDSKLWQWTGSAWSQISGGGGTSASQFNLGNASSYSTPSSLSNNVLAYYKLDSLNGGGNYPDSTATGADLVPTNGPTSVSGIIGNAVHITDGAQSSLLTAGNAALVNNGSFTAAFWFKADSGATTEMSPIRKMTSGGSASQWWVDYNQGSGSNKFQFSLKDAGGTRHDVVTTATFATGAWHFVVIWYDGTNQYIQVNNGTIYSSALTGATFSSGTADTLGIGWPGIGANGVCAIDEFGYWTRALTPTERSTLYNAGAGFSYPFANASITVNLSKGTGFFLTLDMNVGQLDFISGTAGQLYTLDIKNNGGFSILAYGAGVVYSGAQPPAISTSVNGFSSIPIYYDGTENVVGSLGQRCGLATLAAGTATIAAPSITANTRIMLTVQTPGGTQGFLSCSRVAGASFTINSTSATETSTVAWQLLEPGS